MWRLTIADVLAQLHREGLTERGHEDAMRAALARPADDDMPWYLRTAVGLGAWAATALLLAFLLGLDALDGNVERFVFGSALLAAAVLARRRAPAEFVRQAAIAASLAAQWMLIVTVGTATHSGAAAGAAGLLLSVVLILLVPDQVHRFLSVLIAVGSAAVVVTDLDWMGGLEAITLLLIALAALTWRTDVRLRNAATAEVLEPVGYGLVAAIFVMLAFSAATEGQMRIMDDETAGLGVLTTLGFGVALSMLAWRILLETGASARGATSTIVVGSIALLTGATYSSPGIIAGVTVLVLGFDRRNPVLAGMALVFLVLFGSLYYYSLDLTLIEKAGVLAASGLVLLGARLLLVRRTAARA